MSTSSPTGQPRSTAPRAHILLTTDGSPESLRAVPMACDLAKHLGARITLLRIVPELQAGGEGGLATPLGVLHRTTEAEVATVRTELVQALPMFAGTEVELDIEMAETAAGGIVLYANRHGVDLIAMASHGRTGLRRLLLGSTAIAVLRQSRIPVVIFPLVR